MIAVWNSEPAQKTERPLHKPLEFYSNMLASWLQRWEKHYIYRQSYITVVDCFLITAFIAYLQIAIIIV